MIALVRRKLIELRFRHMTRHFDAAIREARRRHEAVNHIKQAKRDFIHGVGPDWKGA